MKSRWTQFKPNLSGFDISRPQSSLLDLHLFRLFYCLLLIFADYDSWGRNARAMTEFPSWHPIPLFEALGVTRISPESFEFFYLLLMVTLIMSAIGWRPRVWLFLSCALFFFVHGQLLSLTKNPDSNYVFHSKNLVVFILFVLAMDKRVGIQSSLIGLVKRSRELYQEKVSSHSLHLIMICYGVVYFGAVYLRFRANGLSWMDGFTLKSYFIDAYFSENSLLALQLAKHHYVCQMLSILTILFEGSFLFLLIFYRPYLFLFVSGILFHLGIYWVMKISFFSYYSFAYLAFLFFSPLALGYWWMRVTTIFSFSSFFKGGS